MHGPLSAALCHAYFQTSPTDVVRSFAQHLHARFQLWSPPIEPEAIARALGLPIERRADIEAEGLLQNWPGDGTHIVMRTLPLGATVGNLRRDRFTVAHELGHYVIRERLMGWCPKDAFRIDDPEEEGLCNRFAAELLMPMSLIAPRVRRAGNDPSAFLALCEEFDVSKSALLRHATTVFPNRLIAMQWKQQDHSFKPTWCMPRRMTPSLLCDNGQTSIERAARSGEVAFGPDTFIIGGQQQRWQCGSMRLHNGELLTIGAREMTNEAVAHAVPLHLDQSRVMAREPRRKRQAVQLSLRFGKQMPVAARRTRT